MKKVAIAFLICSAAMTTTNGQSKFSATAKVPVQAIDSKEKTETVDPLLVDEKLPASPQVVAQKLQAIQPQMQWISTQMTGKKNGTIKAYNANHDLLIVAGWRHNALDGEWKCFGDNGQMQESGTFKNNLPNGEWRTWDANGKVQSIRHYDADKWHAIHNEIQRGNSKVSFYTSSLPGVKTADDFYRFARQNSVVGHPSSAARKPAFTQCILQGLSMTYYVNGRVQDSGYYNNGLREGLWQEWHDNGQIKSSGAWHKGAKDGGWSSYSYSGQLENLKAYRRGKLLFSKNYGRGN